MRFLLAATLLCGALAGSVALAASPNEVIQEAADDMAKRLDGRQDYLAEHPEELYALINEVLLPKFDTRYAGRLVLGKHWRDATPEQRDRFVDAFYNFMLRSYAKGVLKFDQDRVTVLPLTAAPQRGRVVVKTQMRLDDGNEVPVNYSMRETPAGWRVYDVRIEGISYVQNYRNQFNAEIGAKGIDAVIARLEGDAAALDADNAKPGEAEAAADGAT